MRVLTICEYAQLHGAERSLLSVLRRLASRGVAATVAAPSAGPLWDALGRLPVSRRPLDVSTTSGHRLPLANVRALLDRLIDVERPDVLHANSLSTSRWSGVVAARRGVRSVGHLRDMLTLSRQAIADLNAHTRLLAVSHAARQWHAAQGVDPAKLHVLVNGVDLAEFRPRPAGPWLHRLLNLPATALLIGAIGQLGMRKGHDVLLEAMRSVVACRPRVHLVLVGQRTSNKQEAVAFERRLRQAAARSPLAGRVHLVGPRDDVPRLLNACRLLVHPARQEPLGRVLLEAAASGTPIVATRVGGTEQIVPPGHARLVQPDRPLELAAAIRDLVDHPRDAARLAQAAHRRAVARFDARQSAARLAEHFSCAAAAR